jgi:hypothetical protein
VALVRPIVHRTNTKDVARLVRELERCARASEVRELVAHAYSEMGIFDDPELGPMLRGLLAHGYVDRARGRQ